MRNLEHLKDSIRDIDDFPTDGVIFKDIAPALDNPDAFHDIIENLCEHYRGKDIQKIVGIESRGFMFSAPVAFELRAGAVMARKKGKLPAETIRVAHELEYGEGVLEMHRDSIKPGERVVILDDVLATGGTMGAAIKLVEQLKGDIVGLGFLLELTVFDGRRNLPKYDILSLLSY